MSAAAAVPGYMHGPKVALNLSVLLDATPRGAWFTIMAWGLAFAQLCARVEFFAHAIVPTAAGS